MVDLSYVQYLPYVAVLTQAFSPRPRVLASTTDDYQGRFAARVANSRLLATTAVDFKMTTGRQLWVTNLCSGFSSPITVLVETPDVQ